jgi:hypothetical protein
VATGEHGALAHAVDAKLTEPAVVAAATAAMASNQRGFATRELV